MTAEGLIWLGTCVINGAVMYVLGERMGYARGARAAGELHVQVIREIGKAGLLKAPIINDKGPSKPTTPS